ncbi:MAG TPA: CoA-binding protein [Candidatus Bathyarchaeia archaeon]|nr:CoA-binding protein [Candidatus Bathyarchaeia archaeon]
MTGIKAIFEPQTVVLIGSSKIRERVGMTSPQMFQSVIYNMTKFFKGETHVVDLDGKEGSKKLSKVSHTPDLAVVMLPPKNVLAQVQEATVAGIKAFVLLTGGFKPQQRKQLSDLSSESGARILGPNTIMGVINTANGLNTTFERDVMPPKGDISVVSQSGGVGACLLDWACYYGVGVSKFAFMGDKIDVDDVDLLSYFEKDPNTKVICFYMEGVEKGREFIEVAKRVVKQKPILALKGGATKEAAKRALSHTASVAGSDVVFDAAFKKAGIIRVDDIEQLLDSAVALSKQPPLKGDNIAIVSNVGGPAILAADAVVRNGLKLAALSEKTRLRIEKQFPGVEAVNPVDLIADARKDRYSFVLDAVLSDPNVDGLMVINMLKSTFFEPEDALAIVETVAKHPRKPVVDVPAGGEDFAFVQKVLGNTSVPVFNLPEKAAKALKVLRLYSEIREKGVEG